MEGGGGLASIMDQASHQGSLSTMMASSLGRITLTSLGFGKDLSQSADYR